MIIDDSESIDRTEIKQALINSGVSMVVAGSRKRAKIHIHTNDPASIFSICEKFGIVTGQKADDMIHHASEQGYETMANLMAVSNITEEEIGTVLEAIAPTPASTMVIVDSFGHLYREQVDLLYDKYSTAMQGTGKEIGIHAHNNMQLAFANTIEAIVLGSNRADATMAGLGRGAGNCPMELLLGFLRNPKFKLRPVIQLLQEHMPKIREAVEWGPLIPYNITGQLNRHPRAAIEFRAGETPSDFVTFYDQIVDDS